MMAATMAATIPGMDHFNIIIHMGFRAFSYLRFSGLLDHDRRREKEDAKSSQKNWQYLYPKDDSSSLQPSSIAHWYPPTGIRAILEERGGQEIK
jgi:hypothetical protein